MTLARTTAAVAAAVPGGLSMRLRAAARVRCAADAPLIAQLHAPPPGLSEQLARLDRLCGLAVVASERLHAGLLAPPCAPERVAVLCGSRHGCLNTDAAFYRGVLLGEVSPRLFAYTLHSSPVGAVSIHHGYCGPGHTVVGSRVGGLQAVAEAGQLLSSGQADACIVLSCDLAEDRAGHDHAVALLFVPGQVDPAAERGVTVHAAWDAYQGGQPASALAACIKQLRLATDGGPSPAEIAQSEPPLAVLASLWAAAEHGTEAGSSQPMHDGGLFILTETDTDGQAAAVLCSLRQSG